VLKQMIGLATVDSVHAAPGTRVEVEHTVDVVRRRAGARVVPTPFFNPARKTATPPA
jgi:glycine cleavage system aminomethyltransferase T